MFARILIVALLLGLALSIVARSSFGGGQPQSYRVKPYDTLWSIATSHYAGDPRAGVWKIQHRNHLPDATLIPGQTLVLP